MLASGQYHYINFFFSTRLITHTLSIISLLCAALRQNLALHLVIGVAGKLITTVHTPPVNSEVQIHHQYGCIRWVKNSVDPDQLASSEAYTVVSVIIFGHFYSLIKESFPIEKWPLLSQFHVF